MVPIFVYDNRRAISFSFKNCAQAARIGSLIENHGGILAPPLCSHFVVTTQTDSNELITFGQPCVDASWVEDSAEAGSMLPMHQYLHVSDVLQSLDPGSRDIAELIKALMNGDEAVYNGMHRKLPHRTTQQWSELHQQHRINIDTFVLNLKKRADELRLEAETKACAEADQMLIRALHPDPPMELVTHGAPEVNALEAGDDEHLSVSDDSGHGRGRGQGDHNWGNRVTEADVTAMFNFAHSLGREPTKTDWDRFTQLSAHGRRRSAEAWRAAFKRKSLGGFPGRSRVSTRTNIREDPADKDVEMSNTENADMEEEDDGTSDAADSGDPGSETDVAHKWTRNVTSRVRVTEEDREAVKTFAQSLAPRNPRLDEWEQFRKDYPRGTLRSAEAWNQVLFRMRKASEDAPENTADNTSDVLSDPQEEPQYKVPPSSPLHHPDSALERVGPMDATEEPGEIAEGWSHHQNGKGAPVTPEDKRAIQEFGMVFYPHNPSHKDWERFSRTYARGNVRSIDAWSRQWIKMKTEESIRSKPEYEVDETERQPS